MDVEDERELGKTPTYSPPIPIPARGKPITVTLRYSNLLCFIEVVHESQICASLEEACIVRSANSPSSSFLASDGTAQVLPVRP